MGMPELYPAGRLPTRLARYCYRKEFVRCNADRFWRAIVPPQSAVRGDESSQKFSSLPRVRAGASTNPNPSAVLETRWLSVAQMENAKQLRRAWPWRPAAAQP